MASSPRQSEEIDEVRDENAPSPNVPRSNVSRFAPSSDGSDDEGHVVANRKTPASSVIDVDDDSSREEPVAEETDKEERGIISSRKSIGKK
jgi:hypothetical protein